MTASRYIARLIGPLLLTVGASVAYGLFRHHEIYLEMMKSFMANGGLVFVVGMLTLVAGLAIVNAHNLWVADWRVIITVIGWIAILRGIASMMFPFRVRQLGEIMLASSTAPIVGAVITIVLGAILTVMGYQTVASGEEQQQAGTSAPAVPAERATKRTAARRK
jgi:hypothetical protein